MHGQIELELSRNGIKEEGRKYAQKGLLPSTESDWHLLMERTIKFKYRHLKGKEREALAVSHLLRGTRFLKEMILANSISSVCPE